MAGREPEEKPAPAVRMGWHHIAFLHWPLDPDVLRPHLPPGLEPDLFEDQAWLSVTPFQVEGFRAGGVLPLPKFGELNVRTYVTGPDGKDGLWFLTLEADSFATVLTARLGYGVPYRKADVRVSRSADTVHYRSIRGDAGHESEVRLGEPLAPTVRDDWLTGRWRAYGRVADRQLVRVGVRHESWPLRHAELTRYHDALLPSLGLPDLGPPVLVHASDGVEVVLGPPVPVT